MQLEARLRAFSAFARRRSFSAAAAELRISQPAVSKHIADLERALGMKLVDRGRRDGSLTGAGEFVANYILRAESLLAQSVRGIHELRKSGSGSLVIVASWLTGTYLLPEIIADFKHTYPGVRISLELGTAREAIERLRSHRAELGFIAGAVTSPEIEAEPLLEIEIVIVGKPTLLPKRLSRDSLESLPWISREEGSATRTATETAMGRLGIAPRRRFELPSYEAVVCALKKGLRRLRDQPIRGERPIEVRRSRRFPGSRLEREERRLGASRTRCHAYAVCGTIQSRGAHEV